MEFSAYPVPYPVNATNNQTVCSLSGGLNFDCSSAKWEACIVQEHCFAGACDSATQLQLAQFFACYEGPFANQDGATNFERAVPCTQSAGLSLPKVQTCYNSIKGSDTALNSVQKPFFEAAQPIINNGFPYVTVNGAPMADWATMLRTICDTYVAGGGEAPAACTSARFQMELQFSAASGLTPANYKDKGDLPSALVQALDFAYSNVTYPVNFLDDDDPRMPSYLKANTTLNVKVARASRWVDAEAGNSGLSLVVDVYVLDAALKNTQTGVSLALFEPFLALAMANYGFTGVTAADISASVSPGSALGLRHYGHGAMAATAARGTETERQQPHSQKLAASTSMTGAMLLGVGVAGTVFGAVAGVWASSRRRHAAVQRASGEAKLPSPVNAATGTGAVDLEIASSVAPYRRSVSGTQGHAVSL